MQLKRLWDTEGKKIVFTEGPTGHQCQVWTDESGNLYIYDMAQWLAYNGATPEGKEYDRSNWVALTDQTVGFYDTNEATDLYHWDHGDDAYYEFVDWDGTVLKSGTVIEGGTPTAPADPTRPSTAEYRYEFAGWEPAVGPISTRTTYTATYTATPLYTLSFESSIEGAGYFTDKNGNTITSFVVDEGTAIWGYVSISGRPLLFGEVGVLTAEYMVKQHANAGYSFVKWTCNGEDVPEANLQQPIGTVESNITYVAVFEPIISTVTIQSNNTSYGTVSPTTVSNVPYGTTVTVSSNTITIGETTVTATAESGCSFVDWSNAPATITGNVTITANFQSDTPAPTTGIITLSVSGSYESWQDGNGTQIASSEVAIGTVMNVEVMSELAIGITRNDGEYSLAFVASGLEAVTGFKVDGVSKVEGDTITITGDTTFLAECAS